MYIKKGVATNLVIKNINSTLLISADQCNQRLKFFFSSSQICFQLQKQKKKLTADLTKLR